MSGESIGWGAEFQLHNGTALTALEGVYSLTPPDYQTDDVEVTHFKSPQRQREYIAGLIETGEGTFEMNYVPGSATDTLCQSAKAARNVRAFRIIIPGADGEPAWQIDGFCYAKGYQRGIPVDDRMTATLTVKFTGATTEAEPEAEGG